MYKPNVKILFCILRTGWSICRSGKKIEDNANFISIIFQKLSDFYWDVNAEIDKSIFTLRFFFKKFLLFWYQINGMINNNLIYTTSSKKCYISVNLNSPVRFLKFRIRVVSYGIPSKQHRIFRISSWCSTLYSSIFYLCP